MTRPSKKPAPKSKRRSTRVSDAELTRMIEEATVDAYGESEQTVGFLTRIEDNLVVPFRTELLGVEVTVERVSVTVDDRIVAVCVRGKSRQSIPILDLPLPNPAPSGSAWIEAYRHWVRGR